MVPQDLGMLGPLTWDQVQQQQLLRSQAMEQGPLTPDQVLWQQGQLLQQQLQQALQQVPLMQQPLQQTGRQFSPPLPVPVHVGCFFYFDFLISIVQFWGCSAWKSSVPFGFQ